MEIKKIITIELSEKDVKEIIADYLIKDGYPVTADDVTLSSGSRIEGYGLDEHEVNYFKAAYVKCRKN